MQRVPVFSGVSATEMRHLAAIAHQAELIDGAILSAETDPPVVCVVLSGAVSMEAPGDETAGPSPAEPGDVTGLFEALAGQDGDASSAPRRLRVTRAGTALRIDREDLYDLLGQRPNLLQQIFTALFGRRSRHPEPTP